MDLRQKKTLRAIEQAFYALRKQKKLEAITVTELCRNAEISKATFYLHYRDIFDLSGKMQDNVIEAVFSKLEDPMEILTDHTAFMTSFVRAVEQESERVKIVFSDSQSGTLPVRIVHYLKEQIFAKAPHLREDPKVQVFLTYFIMGGYYTCMESGESDYMKILKILETIQPQFSIVDQPI